MSELAIHPTNEIEVQVAQRFAEPAQHGLPPAIERGLAYLKLGAVLTIVAVGGMVAMGETPEERTPRERYTTDQAEKDQELTDKLLAEVERVRQEQARQEDKN